MFVKSDAVVRMTLPEDNQTILAAEYKLQLPSEEQLLAEVRKATEAFEAMQDAERENEELGCAKQSLAELVE